LARIAIKCNIILHLIEIWQLSRGEVLSIVGSYAMLTKVTVIGT